MRKLFKIIYLTFFLVPTLLRSEPIVLDNDNLRVFLKDSWVESVEETGQKYDYSFEVTDKKARLKSKIKVNTYGIHDAFLTPNRLNLVTSELRPGTCGRTPPSKFSQYDLSTSKRTIEIANVQDAYFSPSKRFGVMAFTFNPYEDNEFDAVGFVDLILKPVRLKWLNNRQKKINLFVFPKDDSEKIFHLDSAVGWSSDEKEMAFIVSWYRTDEITGRDYRGRYLVYVKYSNEKFLTFLRPVDFEKIGYKNGTSPWIDKVELSPKIATFFIHESKGKHKKLRLELPN